MHTKYLRRLPLKNIYNARDLGGYYCDKNSVTKWKTFLRTDDLHYADNSDKQFLKSYGVKTIIDLRSEEEIKNKPNPFCNDENFKYYNIPFNVSNLADATKKVMELKDNTESIKTFMPNFYVDLLKNGGQIIKEIFETFAKNEDGIVLYHCTAGKDRTGIISMLLLGLAGTSNADIINNYIETYNYLIESPYIKNTITEENKYPKEMEQLLYSNPEYITPALDYVNENFENIFSYLLSTGLTKSTLNKIKNNFTEK